MLDVPVGARGVCLVSGVVRCGVAVGCCMYRGPNLELYLVCYQSYA